MALSESQKKILARGIVFVGALLPAAGVALGIWIAKHTDDPLAMAGAVAAFAEAGRRATKFAKAIDPTVED